MKLGCLLFSFACFNVATAQTLIPLYGVCSNSVQCIGVAICINRVCQCPPAYKAVGITCVYAGPDTDPFSLLPPVPSPNQPAPSIGVGQSPVSPIGSALAYPGSLCSPGSTCIGGSVCVQGVCQCPPGHVLAGYSCVPRTRPAGPPSTSPLLKPALPVGTAPLAPTPVEEEVDALFGPKASSGGVLARSVGGVVPVGGACTDHQQCVVGGYCQGGLCQCRPAFFAYRSICVIRRRAKDEPEMFNYQNTPNNG